MANKTNVLKRCRALGIEPGYLGYNKKSNRNPKKSNKKISEYGLQLREKQKAKFVYGVSEKQFRKYYKMADNKKGKTGDILFQILESRLDNVIYRLGFATTRAQARMLVTHGTFTVNGVRVDVPSYLVKEGDIVEIKENKKDNKAVKEAIEVNESIAVPTWLEKDTNKISGKVVRLAAREDIDLPIEEHLIVEYYSK